MSDRKEHVLAKALPERSSIVNEESLKEIFNGFTQGLEKKDVKLCVRICGKLGSFLDLKGYLDLDERGELTEILFKILYLPDHSLHTQVKVLKAIRRLLAKRRVGLEIKVDWKKLWGIVENVHLRIDENGPIAGSSVRSGHAGELANVCLSVRRYLKEDDIDDVATLAYSWMEDPMSRNQFIGVAVLFLFMPSVKSEKYHSHLERWMKLWERVEHSSEWNSSWLHLVRRALKWGGTTHLSPVQISQLHRRVLESMQLEPQSGTRLSSRVKMPSILSKFSSSSSRMTQQAAKITVALLGCCTAQDFYRLPQEMEADFTSNSKDELAECLEKDENLSAGLLYVRNLLSSIQTLFHPSNSSSFHSNAVVTFTTTLCSEFAKRLGRERAAKASHQPFGEQPVLSTQDKAALVDTVIPLLKMACYSKSNTVKHYANMGITQLAYVAPVKVYQAIMPMITDALDPSNLNQTHQAPAAISVLTALMQPLLQAKPLLAEVLPTLLELTLPGLDANDTTKTITTCGMLQGVLSWVPIIDVTDLDFPSTVDVATHGLTLSDSYGIDSPEEEAMVADEALARDAMWRGSPALVDWSLQCLDRILAFIDTQVGRAKSGFAAQLDYMVLSHMALTTRLLLSQMHTPVLAKAGKRLHEWALGSVNPDAMKESKLVIRSYVSAVFGRGAQDVKLLTKGLLEPLLEQAADTKSSEKKRIASLTMLGAVIRVAGEYLLPYEDQLQSVIELALKDKVKAVKKLGGKLIRRTMRGLSEKYIKTASSTPALEQNSSPSKLAIAAVTWGQPSNWEDLAQNISEVWHIPTEEELAMANRFKDIYLDKGLKELEKALENKSMKSKSRTDAVRDSLEVLFQVARGMSTITPSFDERAELILKVCKLLPVLLSEFESDTVSHRRAMKVIQVLLITHGSMSGSASVLEGRQGFYRYLRSMSCSKAYMAELQASVDSDIVKNRADWLVPRYSAISEVGTLFKRQKNKIPFQQAQAQKDSGDESVFQQCWAAIMQANMHDWSDTRKAAKAVAGEILNLAPWFGKAQMFNVVPLLAASEGSHGRVLGAVSLLNSKRIVRWIASDWELLDTFMRVVVFESPSGLLRLEDDKQKEVGESLQKQIASVLGAWSTIPIVNKKQEKIRQEMLKDFTSPQKTSSLHWRQRMVVCVLTLTLALQRDDPCITTGVLDWMVECASSEMMPLRTTACSCFVQLLDRVPAGKMDGILDQLGLSDAFYRSMVDALSQDHSIAHTSVDGSTKGMKQRSDWSVGVGEMMKLAQFPINLKEGATYIWANSTTFKKSHKCLVQRMCTLAGDTAISAMEKQLDYLLFENVHTAEYQSKVAAGAEVFSGVSSVASSDKLLSIVIQKLSDSTFEAADVWLEALRLCSKRDMLERMMVELLDQLKSSLDMRENISQAVISCNFARALNVIFYEVAQDIDLNAVKQAIQIILSAQNHPFEKVRRELARLVVCCVDVLERFESPERQTIASEALEGILSASRGLERTSTVGDATRLVETAMQTAYYLIMAGGLARHKYTVNFVPIVLESQGHPNQDLVKIARAAARTMCNVPVLDQSKAIEMVKMVATIGHSQDSNWHARQSACVVLGSLMAVNSALLGYAAGSIHTRKEMEKFLRDTQVEVQNIASATLTGVFSTYLVTSPSLAKTKDRYLKLATTKIKKDQLKTEDGKAKLKKRMTGVLGLAALVHSAPYSVPFPDAVVALAKRVADPNPVGPQAKEAVQTFKHTHTDSWAETRTYFTSEELEDLQDSSYSGAHA